MTIKPNYWNRGFTVSELVIGLALLGMVLALGYTFFSYSTTLFARGEAQSNVQQNIRLAANYITSEIRFANSAKLFSSPLEIDYTLYDNYLYMQNGTLMHGQNSAVSNVLGALGDVTDLTLTFTATENSPILTFTISGEMLKQGTLQDFSLSTEVQLLNIPESFNNNFESVSSVSGSVIGFSFP